MSIRVFLLDDHEIVRRGVRELVDSTDDMEVVGEASTGAEALARVAATRPDVALLDVRLADGSGIEVCRDLRSAHPDLACVMLTSFSDDEALIGAVMAGAAGYVLKDVRGSKILDTVRRVAAGESLIDADRARLVGDRLRPEVDERLRDLTPREGRILELLAEGRTNRQIGEELYLAEKTIKNHVSNVLAKMGMSRRTEAAVYVTKLNLAHGDHHHEGPRSP